MSADRLHELVVAHGGVLTRPEALQAGVTTSALHWWRQKGAVHELRRGVFTSTQLWEASSPKARHRLLVLAQQRVHPRLVASGTSAATLWSLPTPSGPPTRPELTAARLTKGGGGR